jgi:squalene cyclase
MMPDALHFLTATQDLTGGWGYTLRGTPGLEPTALAILALCGLNHAAPVVQRALDWLITTQHEDGGWGLNGSDPRSSWHTAWGVLALAGLAGTADSSQRGRAWLAAVPVYREENLDAIRSYNQDLKIDVSLTAWPWGPAEGSWVLPTALAMLALKGNSPQPEARSRLDEAVRYLENRRVPGGGWNVGNPAMFDGVLPAHTIPTALSLLALHAHAPTFIQPGDTAVLRQKAIEDGGAKALGWALLTLRTLGEETSALLTQLLAVQQADGSWEGNPHSTAIALLGLEGVI